MWIIYLLVWTWQPKGSSAAVAYPLRGLEVTHCVFRDALLHTTVVMCGYLHVTVTFLSALTSLALLLWPLSLTMRFCPQNCCSLDVFCFSHHSLQTFCCAWKSQEISSFWDTLTTLSGTNNHSTVKVTLVTFLPHSDIWSEKQLNLLTTSACFYAFSCCHMIGWLNICINKLVYRST